MNHHFESAVSPSSAGKATAGAFAPRSAPVVAPISACIVLPSAVLPAVGDATASSLSGVLEQERPDTLSSDVLSNCSTFGRVGAIGDVGPGASLDPLSSTGTASHVTPAVPASVLRICSHAITFAAAAESLIQSSLTSITALIEGFVMRSTYEEKVVTASKNARTIVQGTARLCSPVFGNVCKAIWPFKTAEQLAALVGCSVRAAAYEISGEREPSAQSILAVMDAMIPKKGRA